MERQTPIGDFDQLIRIDDAIATVELAPDIGGAIASYRWRDPSGAIDWLRPATSETLLRRAPDGMGCFALVPYSNRIRAGRFQFAGRTVQLPTDAGADPHFEHGHGWRNRWEVVEHDKTSAVIRYRHAADAWPWDYEAEQRMVLQDGALCIAISLRNLSTDVMPFGFGLHPYFPSSSQASIEAGIERIWQTDGDVLPTALAVPEPQADPNSGITVSQVELDTVFTGWSQRARIVWPEHGRTLDIQAEAPLNYLVLYTPAGEPYFCAEPVSNITDAFNMEAQGEPNTGMMTLDPGESRSTSVTFTPIIRSAI